MTSEQLLNLQRIGLLDPVPFSQSLLEKLLTVAHNRIQDAFRQDNSMETRFDCAYTAIRAIADAALLKQGLRTSTSKPGHHQTSLQCLAYTLILDASTIRILDSLRKQRNLTDYDGELVTESLLQECLLQANALFNLAQQVLK
jgi:hypothetical protein